MNDYDRWIDELDEELLIAYGVVAADVWGFEPRDHFGEPDDMQTAIEEAGSILEEEQVAIAMLLGIFIGGA
jgi:hypothetical protein